MNAWIWHIFKSNIAVWTFYYVNFSQRYDINMKLHQKLGIVLKNQDLSSTYLLTILFTRFWMWLSMRFFAYLRYSYSMEHQLSQSYLTKLVGNRIWLQIQAEIQFADSTDSMQVCSQAELPWKQRTLKQTLNKWINTVNHNSQFLFIRWTVE